MLGAACRAVNALLTHLDRLRTCPNVLILATSNLAAAVDAAFIDRADIKAYIGPPGPQVDPPQPGSGLCMAILMPSLLGQIFRSDWSACFSICKGSWLLPIGTAGTLLGH